MEIQEQFQARRQLEKRDRDVIFANFSSSHLLGKSIMASAFNHLESLQTKSLEGLAASEHLFCLDGVQQLNWSLPFRDRIDIR